MLGAVIAISASLSAATPQTDFGVRVVGASPVTARGAEAAVRAFSSGRVSLSAAAALARQWGRVTSTYRSRDHNRRVGGVVNSFHLSGRAIDIARRPGVRHRDLEAAFRNAGYRLVESLDEGDHSHFAFSFGGGRTATLTPLAGAQGEATEWRIVVAPR